MEVKDINNSNTIQAMFSKAIANNASGQMLGAGFASLVNQLGDLGGSLAKGDGVKNVVKDQGADNKVAAASDKVEVKKDKTSKKARPAADKADKPVARQMERKQNVAEAVPVNVAQEASAPEAPKAADGVVEAAPVAAAENAPMVQPVENAEPVMRELQVSLLGQQEAPLATMNGDEIVLFPDTEVNVEALAQMPTVAVLDESTGEVVSMSGEEFVAKLQQASDQGELYIAQSADEGMAQLVPAEIAAKKERSFAPSEAQNAAPEQVAEYVDEQLAAQAQVLDEKVGRNQNVKVEVSVADENAAVVDDVALVKDQIALDEAIAAANEDGAAVTDKQPEVARPMSAEPQAAQPQTAGQVNPQVAPVMAQTVAVEAQSSAEAANVSAIEGVNNAAAQGQSANVALAGNARTEGNAQTTETYFRDIYKGMSKEVVEQVKVNITKSAIKGVDTIDIKLKPEDLGHIQIKMQISKDGKLQAHIIAGRPETMEILQEEVQSLEKAFQDAGFDTDSGSFSFSFSEDAESREQDRNAELRSFIGNALEQDNLADAGNDNTLGWTAEGGLNIRV